MKRQASIPSSPLEKMILLGALLAYGLFSWAGLPIHTVADELPILKSAYQALAAGSLKVQSSSPYSVWVHLIHLPGLMLYWLGAFLAQGLPPLAEFKRMVLADYQMALAGMRAINGLLFVLALWLAKRTGDETVGRPYGLWLFLLLAGNVLILAQAHTIKHWIPAYSLALIGFYLAHGAYARSSLARAAAAYALLAVSILTLPVVVFLLPYLPLLYARHKGRDLPGLLRQASLLCVVGGAAWLLTAYLGAGENVARGGSYLAASPDWGFILSYLRAFALIQPLQAAALAASLALLALGFAERAWLWMLPVASAAAGLLFLSLLGAYGHYYALLLFFTTAPVAALAPARLASRRPRVHGALLMACLLISLLAVGQWCRIVSAEDTRQQAASWLMEHQKGKSFVLYDTMTTSYLAPKPETARVLTEILPAAVGTRERSAREHELPGEANGVPVWRVTQTGVGLPGLVDELLARGYRVFYVHERFGEQNNIAVWHPGMTERLSERFNLDRRAVFEPFAGERKALGRTGDILHDFGDTASNLLLLERPGPVVTIFEASGMNKESSP